MGHVLMPPDSLELLKTLLEPLLADFQYWFSQAEQLLTSEQLTVLDREQQLELLGRVQQAQQAVMAAQSLFVATQGTVGVEANVLLRWHQLVAECWRVARWQRQQANAN